MSWAIRAALHACPVGRCDCKTGYTGAGLQTVQPSIAPRLPFFASLSCTFCLCYTSIPPFLPVVSFFRYTFFLLNPPHPTIFLAIFFVSVSLFVGALALSQFYLLRSSGR